ncbi:MAG: hypothetical protein Q4G22_08910 [Paracoccus sp. (in: a-proteobacteria)]|uniref:hypothetical protein n=1 Tax=Paracoccus sp. TaxID=267 RepID=UPI0026DFC4E3|nr:hypothetical protein [Paracoccus sp. (in: a-proteobacteria)]MDO5631944.1 hypothetical protein [Paracoccus sp. (in: a-proteobacteria)]
MMRSIFFAGILLPGAGLALEPQTDLSKQAGWLSLNTTRCEVVSLLGDPGWIYKQGEDSELADDPIEEWIWRNTPCAPVRVQISTNTDLVTGWDEGRVFCGIDQETEERFLPDDQFLLSETRTTSC